MASLDPPPPSRPRSRALVTGLGGLLLGLAVATAVYFLALRDSGSVAVSSPTPHTSASPSLSPTATPTPQNPPAVVTNVFNKSDSWTEGSRLAFRDFWMHYPDGDCAVHTYTLKGKTRGAFESDCASWENSGQGYDILIFYVGFRNRSQEVVTLILRNFVLVARDGRTFGPVNVRSEAKFPTSFLPETQKLPPKTKWYGYVTFDGRVRALIPASISYIDGKQTLTQTFEGRHHAVPAS